MKSLIPSQKSGLRLLLISAGVLLAASASAAQPTFDPQAQAREIIVPKPFFAASVGSEAIVTATASMPRNRDFDAQAQARRFVLATPKVSAAIDATSKSQSVSAQGNPRVDAQEQARLFILAKPNLARLTGPAVLSVSERNVALEAAARRQRF
jgi:hypothetical protein